MTLRDVWLFFANIETVRPKRTGKREEWDCPRTQYVTRTAKRTNRNKWQSENEGEPYKRNWGQFGVRNGLPKTVCSKPILGTPFMNQEQIYSSSQRERDWAVLNFRKEPWSPASPALPGQSQSVTWGFPDVFYGLNQNPIVLHNSKGQTAEEWKLKKKWRMDERGLRGLFLHKYLSLIRVKTEWFNDCPTRKNGANLT